MLQTWSQQNNWAYWYQPWYQRKESLANFRAYLKLRYRLFPYIYTAGAEASRTGFPVVRALPLVYPDVVEYDKCKTTYMLGDKLLVGAYTDTLNVPEGTWYEWRTDAKVAGPCKIPLEITPQWGGALYVKAGSVIPTWPEVECIDCGYRKDVILEAYAGADGDGELYEDDGISLKYKTNKHYAIIPLKLTQKDGVTRLAVGARKGAFGGSKAVREFTVRFHALERKPISATVDGKAVTGTWCEKTRNYTIASVEVGAKGATFEVK
jgi:alpha-D-xyloside xylohydrolase